MDFKGLLLSLGLPPTCFLFLAIFAQIFGRNRRGRFLVSVALLGLFVLSLPAVSGAMMFGLEQDLPRTPPAGNPPKAIVILGGDLQRTADAPFVLPGELSFERERAGAELWRKTKLPILVAGGVVQQDRPPVARVMSDSLHADFQVPVEWIEDSSTTTWENANLSAAILKQHGIASVYVVTHAWHMKRAIIAFRHAGIAVTAAPTLMDSPTPWTLEAYIPSVSAWQGAYFAVHEWIGCVWYQIR